MNVYTNNIIQLGVIIMNRKLILIATMALVLASCGENDVANTGKPSMLDKSMDSTGDAANAVSDTDSSVTDASKTEEITTEEALEYMDKEMEQYKGIDQ
jgi:hypothetical protein